MADAYIATNTLLTQKFNLPTIYYLQEYRIVTDVKGTICGDTTLTN